MKKLLDTNAILRYLLNDILEQADMAEQEIQRGAFTLPEIIAEVVYVLLKVYKVPRDKISGILTPVFDEIDIATKEVIAEALRIYADTSFDFADCILAARKHILGDEIFTFDKKIEYLPEQNVKNSSQSSATGVANKICMTFPTTFRTFPILRI